MLRLFVALELDPALCAILRTPRSDVEGAHWQRDDQLHLTLAFIGEVAHPLMREIEGELARVHFDPFDLALSGVGAFGRPGQPRVLWAGVENPTPILHLHEKIARAMERMGVAIDQRKFKPHVTLARFRRGAYARVGDWLSRHGHLVSPPQRVDHFTLFSSHRTDEGCFYRAEARFGRAIDLSAADVDPDDMEDHGDGFRPGFILEPQRSW